MKRLLLAACLAVGVHVALLSFQTQWTTPTRLMPQNRSVTVSLVEAPPAPAPKVLPQPKKPPEPKSKPKPNPKPEPEPVTAPEPVVAAEPVPEPEPLPEAEPAQPEQQQTDETPQAEETPSIEPPGSQEGAVIQSSVPRYDINPSPGYPRVAKRRGYEGTVVLEVLVTREGRVGQIRVEMSSGYSILDRRALETVRKWLFTPALKGSETVEMWVEQSITFRLE